MKGELLILEFSHPLNMTEFLPTTSQKECIEKHLQSLKMCHFTANYSEMGLGKTLLAEKIAEDLDLPILLVCDPIIQNGWMEKNKNFFNNTIKFISLSREADSSTSQSVSYSILTGKKGMTSVCYDLLLRVDPEKKDERPSFTPTQKLIDIVEQGVFVVIDESQNLKNISSDRFWAMKSVISLIKKNFDNGGRSRVIFLSATPFDKRDQIYHFLYLVSISKNQKILKKGGVEYSSTPGGRNKWEMENRYYGLLSSYDYILSFFERNFERKDADNLAKRTEKLSLNYKYWIAEEAKELIIEMYLSYIHPYISCVMFKIRDTEDEGKYTYDRKNGFYCVSPEAEAEIRTALDTLSLALLMKEKKEENYQIKFNGMITTGMRLKEYAKRDLFIELISSTLSSSSTTKVIVGLDFKNTLFYLRDHLQKYSPLIIYGDTPNEERIRVIDSFNEPNTNHRLLLLIVSTGKAGIDLHDTDGKYPRVMFLSPSYNFQNLTQMSGRIFRKGVKSSPMLRLVFSKQNPEEMKIVENLSKKVDVQRSVVGVKEGQLLPGEYDNIYQDECTLPSYFPSPKK